MAAAIRKRPALEGACPAVAGGKRARYQFGSIYDYEKLEVLGEGSYGVVVKARDRRTGETVAVKWIKSGDGGQGAPGLRAVAREARCLAACRGHPSIVQVKDVAADEHTGDVFIVMEFVGPSLQSFITRRFSEAETRSCMRQLLRGAEKMHDTGTIHRDLKPDNILVGPGGALKICDLGMATPMNPAGTPYPEECVCTLWYRAPELLMGFRCYGPAVDMWSLGCVMAELLTGKALFEDADTEDDMLAKVLDLRYEMTSTEIQAFEDLPELSEAGREVLCGLLSFEPEERLTAADALNHRWFAEEDAPTSPALWYLQDRRSFFTFL
ncbi:putative cyclin-dependent kinase F-2 [Phragmites australis]|uniref:putative cyclin-dependent kinase F-2 n=1 Tax=Phragmites australis TaxID=29695 RepID=UPI002D7819F3|nr:putative cyclin-dependent kinase F-2 [Phragmites australis]